MSKIKRLSYTEKLNACKLYEQGKHSFVSIANKFGISTSALKLLYFKYKNFGPKALKMRTENQSYTNEFINSIVNAYKNGEGTYNELAIKYKITNPPLICSWVLEYNKSNRSKNIGEGGVTLMGRKTTLEERIEIIRFLINNENDYMMTSSKYNVSYAQVYTWSKKYKEYGVEGLHDNRGRKKQVNELSELELLRKENARLTQELELSKAAEQVLKKKQSLQEKTHLQELKMKNRIKR